MKIRRLALGNIRTIAPNASLVLLLCGAFAIAALRPATASPAPSSHEGLRIYFVDVEGGQSTLFVTPAGKSLLIDTGWPGNNGRDADRIVAAAKLAGVSKIDFVLLTHYHEDHTGGVPQLAAKIPIGTFIDHGVNREPGQGATEDAWQAYQKLLATGKYKRIIAKPGESLPVPGLEVKVISADGNLIEKPLEGAGDENSVCKTTEAPAADHTENARSLGVLITFHKLRILDLGDLTKDKERELMCPVNKLGKIDIFVISHHGSSLSDSPELVDGIAPRVAIMDNGATKGGSPSVWDTIEKAPHLENLWQLHYSNEGGEAHNVPAEFIANPQGTDAGHFLELTAKPDGSFAVFNARTKETKQYAAKSAH
ncbi:MAG TPA: MBL fold metallo-hydrolase [Candidatus Acidoferrum sp.]|nr:MBL fold metallo-hydrolase [Candidatus Acidoferrum sp.]